MPYTQAQLQSASSRLRRYYRYEDGTFDRIAFTAAVNTLRDYERRSNWEIQVALYAEDDIFCEGCGEPIGYVTAEGERVYRRPDSVVEVDGNAYCDDACAEDDGWQQCSECSEWFAREDAIESDDGYYCSEECAENASQVRCECCGNWHAERNMNDVRNGGEVEQWCDNCSYNYSRSCDHCGDRFHEDEVSYDEASGQDLCEGCYHDRMGEWTEWLHSYGHTPRLNFYDVGESVPLYLGIELETDGGEKRGTYVNELHAISVGGVDFGDHFWMTEDSSLSNGVEITGHPMTLKYLMGINGIFEAIRETAMRYGFVSHDGGRCGLHVHVNQSFFGKTRIARENAYLRLLRLMQRHEYKFHMFSRRLNTRWCDYKTSMSYAAKDDVVKILPHESQPNVFDKARHAAGNSFHSQCVGFRSVTIEFRIFRGTLKLSTLYASLAMVDGLCRAVKEHGSYWCESVSWYDLMDEVIKYCDDPAARDCLVAYLEEKGLR